MEPWTASSSCIPAHRDIAYAYYLRALCYYEQIADIQRDQRGTEQAMNALQEVVNRFPGTTYARDASLKVDLCRDHLAGKEMEIGRFYQKQHLYEAAIGRFQRVVDDFQTTNHVPEALHRLTEIYLVLGLRDEARKTASVLGYNYPGNQWYEDSYTQLVDDGLATERKHAHAQRAGPARLLLPCLACGVLPPGNGEAASVRPSQKCRTAGRFGVLTALAIRDVVLIERLDLSFGHGLTVLTGETGAGKSILLDSLGLALGARAESGLVRAAAEQACVTACFTPAEDHAVAAVLDEHGLISDDEVVLRRIVTKDGRSRAFVNDHPVGVGLLRHIGGLLVEVQGQHEQMSLADPASHAALLDAFGVPAPLRHGVARAWSVWREAVDTLDEARAAIAAAERDEEWLRLRGR